MLDSTLEKNDLLENMEDDDYQLEVFDEYRTSKKFSFLGFIIGGAQFVNDVKWTGKFFGYVNVREKKIKERYTDFDSGWSYQSYWKEWKTRWILIKILG